MHLLKESDRVPHKREERIRLIRIAPDRIWPDVMLLVHKVCTYAVVWVK